MENGLIPFVRMNGLGNEILVVDARSGAVRLDAEAVRRVHASAPDMGFDQLMLVLPASAGADAAMRIYNADGSEVSACGNGTRCVADLLMRESGAERVRLDSPAGPLVAERTPGGGVRVDMGPPRLSWEEIPLAEPFHDTRRIELNVGPAEAPILHSPSVVSMGNPHAIFWVDDVDAYDLAAIGPFLEHHPLFPEGANISLAEVRESDAIRLKVWERGAGLTRACGTAACAALVAAHRLRRTGRAATLALPGGDLRIEWREGDGHVLMTGPAETAFAGRLDPATLMPEPA